MTTAERLRGWSKPGTNVWPGTELLSQAADELDSLQNRCNEQQKLLASVREGVCIEIAAYGDCHCDGTQSKYICAYCSAINFNAQTNEKGEILDNSTIA